MKSLRWKRTLLISGLGIALSAACCSHQFVQSAAAQPKTTAPNSAGKTGTTRNTTTGMAGGVLGNGQVEVVFVLDTTGSMSGLIEGAKQKIWSIVNEIASAKPAPVVKIGFVGYRDKGDAYVTQVHDLDADLDGAFSTLSKFGAAGGGDTPEHVNKALHDAVHNIRWGNPAKLGSLYQVMFLVGDCPPHTDYDDGFDYKKHVKEAIARGIIVNAIRCGNQAATEPVWQEVARMGEGRYFSIAQEGGMVAIDTPYDKEISAVADEIETTTVARGGKGYSAAKRASAAANAELAPSSKAERAQFNAKSSQVYGGWDITTGVMDGRIKLEDLKEEDLPKELKELSKPDREKYIAAKIKQRREGQK